MRIKNLEGENMSKNKGQLIVVNLPTDYCAFMVAIVLVRLVINEEDVGHQYTAEELSNIVNILPHSKSANFYVNSVALKHGLSLFKREISKRGINVIEVYKEERGLTKYFNFEANRRSIELKFESYKHSTEGATPSDVLDEIARCRDQIFKAYRFQKSIHPSASPVYGDLIMKSPKAKQKLRIKSPSKLCKRTIQNTAQKLIQSVEKEYGENVLNSI